jgi:hypothetical protein
MVVGVVSAVLLTGGCDAGSDQASDLGSDLTDDGQALPPAAGDVALAAAPLADELAVFGMGEVRRVFTSDASYRAWFGHAAPGLDFAHEWVVFAHASSDDDEATITRVALSADGTTLKITTSVGSACVGNPSAQPFALARIPRPEEPRPTWASFLETNVSGSCTRSCNRIGYCLPGWTWSRDACECTKLTRNCSSNAECTLATDNCGSCECRALGPGESVPPCSSGPGVECLVDPCAGRTAACQSGVCVAR